MCFLQASFSRKCLVKTGKDQNCLNGLYSCMFSADVSANVPVYEWRPDNSAAGSDQSTGKSMWSQVATIHWDKEQERNKGSSPGLNPNLHSDLTVLVFFWLLSFSLYSMLSVISDLSQLVSPHLISPCLVFIHFLIPVCILSPVSHSLGDTEFTRRHLSCLQSHSRIWNIICGHVVLQPRTTKVSASIWFHLLRVSLSK